MSAGQSTGWSRDLLGEFPRRLKLPGEPGFGTKLLLGILLTAGLQNAFLANWQPHLHALVSAGVFSGEGVFTPVALPPAGVAEEPFSIANNIVEGFSGASGVGIELSADDVVSFYGANSVFNCATTYDISGLVRYAIGDNETPGSSVFADAANDDFTVNTDMKEGGSPTSYPGISLTNRLDKGAVQREEPAGGGGVIKMAGDGGGMVG